MIRDTGIEIFREQVQDAANYVGYINTTDEFSANSTTPDTYEYEDTSPTVSTDGASSYEFRVVSEVTSADTSNPINGVVYRLSRDVYQTIHTVDTEGTNPVSTDIQRDYYVVADGTGRRVDIYNSADDTLFQSITGLAIDVESAALSPDGDYLAIVYETQVSIYDYDSVNDEFDSTSTVLIGDGLARRAVWSKDSSLIAILTIRDSSDESRIYVVNTSGVAQQTIDEGSVDWSDATWNDDDSFFVAVAQYQGFYKYDTSDWSSSFGSVNITSCAFTNDGEYLVYNNRGNILRANRSDDYTVAVVKTGTDFIYHMSAAGDKICYVTSGGKTVIYDPPTNSVVTTFAGGSPGVSYLHNDYGSTKLALATGNQDEARIIDEINTTGKAYFINKFEELDPDDGDIQVQQSFVYNQQ